MGVRQCKYCGVESAWLEESLVDQQNVVLLCPRCYLKTLFFRSRFPNTGKHADKLTERIVGEHDDVKRRGGEEGWS